MTNQIYGRFCQKHDTEANWLQAKNFAPLAGELIIYDADENYNYPRFKVGIWDGTSEKTPDMMVNNLPFTISEQLFSITYSELKALRDNNQLIPGIFYRITDYKCTTSQEGTRAMNNKFDIIVQALSENTLSENAKADYHKESIWSGTATILPEFIQDADNELLVVGSVTPDYYEYIDTDGPGLGMYKDTDVFVAYSYGYNNNGIEVPVLYKTDSQGLLDEEDEGYNSDYAEPDYGDAFYYVGRTEINGVTYDKWRKIELASGEESEFSWTSIGKAYLYTNVITELEEGSTTTDTTINGIQPEVANIPAWELKYCLDNDTDRFAWADGEQGKGVIYYMKDEWNNECPYDFKNIQFQRSVEWQEEHSDFIDSLGLAVDDLQWFYTFSYINMENLTAEDLTLKQDLLSDDGSMKYGTHDNSILPYTRDATSIPRIALNNNVMIYCPEADSCFYGCYGNNFKNNCYDNTFGNECISNTLGTDCFANTCGNSCFSITFGDECYLNNFGNGCNFTTFGNNCAFNTFGNYCTSNTFGNYCTSNTFGNACNSNTFGNECNSITFGTDCSSNTFGNECNSITFGTDCSSNTFGNECNSITFGTDCSSNTFGNGCYCNTFGSSADSLIAYAKYIRFADGCTYVKLLNSESGDGDNYVQNITISAGVSGTSHSPLELQVSRNAAPVVYEAAGTTHIILD